MSLDDRRDLEAAIEVAEAYWRQGRFQMALIHYRKILMARLTSRRASDLHAVDLMVIERLADLAALFGHIAAADKLLDGMARLCHAAGNIYAADYTDLKRVHLALVAGQLHTADQLLQAMQATIGDIRAIDFTPSGVERWEAALRWPNTDSSDRAVLLTRLYLAMGWLLACLGQYRAALVALRRGLRYTGPMAPDLAHQAAPALQLAIAAALVERGDLAEAGDELVAIERDCLGGGQPGYAVRWLELDGQIALLRGDYGRALRQVDAVRTRCAAGHFTQAELRAALNQAHVRLALNQTTAAEDLLNQAEQRSREVGDHIAAGRIALLRQVAHARSQSLADSVSIAPSVIALWIGGSQRPPVPFDAEIAHPQDLPQVDQYLAFFDDRALSFQWLIAYHHLSAARHSLTQMCQTFKVTDSPLIHTRLNVLTGMLAYYEGALDQATALFATALPSLETRGLLPELWQVQRFLGWCWAKQGHSEPDRLALSQATDRLLAALTGSLEGADRALFLLNKWTAEEEYFAAQADQLARLKRQGAAGSMLLRPLRHLRLIRCLSNLVRQIDRYKDLRARHMLTRDETTLFTRAKQHWHPLFGQPRDRATISFLVLPDRVLVIVAHGYSLDFGVSPLTRIQLRNLVRRWHESVRQTAWHGPDRKWTLASHHSPQYLVEQHVVAAEIADALQIDVILAGLPASISALTIVPDDSLHGVPFAALPVGGRPLIERYRLTIAYEHGHHIRSRRTRIRRGGALLVGVSRGVPGLSALPGVLDELREVESWMAQHSISSRCLVDDGAARTQVLEALPEAALVHIACHGVFEIDRPDCSGIVLIPAPGHVETISLRDLAALDLTQLQHVTLSSCWSADNFILPGRRVISVPEALWRSGVHSILGSLWEVHDQLAVAFMTTFYTYLATAPRDEALRRTQLDCLHGRLAGYTAGSTSDPVCWAGFVLFGDHAHLVLGTSDM